MKVNNTFTMPLFLVFQIYTTEKGDKIAWASTFSEFLVYMDRDENAIYSVGDVDGKPFGIPTFGSGDEYCGSFIPELWNRTEIREGSVNHTGSGSFPSDRTVDEMASSIKFTPPSLTAADTVTWDIEYRDYPILASIFNNDIPFEQWVTQGSNLYADQSPGDFSYGFDYKIGGGKADLSLTLGLPKISGFHFYNTLQEYDLGLSIPQYNFFVTSFDINEVNPKEITIPSDRFIFESNNETVAEMNLINPVKRNYSLYDYPKTGEITSIESQGASINNLIMANSGFSGHIASPEINFLYTIKDFVNEIPGFTIVDDLYHVYTENYPVWAGEKLAHDPTNTIYFKNITLPFKVATDLIPGFNVVILFGSISLAVLVITLELRKFKKK